MTGGRRSRLPGTGERQSISEYSTLLGLEPKLQGGNYFAHSLLPTFTNGRIMELGMAVHIPSTSGSASKHATTEVKLAIVCPFLPKL